jgi:N-acyl-D-aspartate/D-glutamate deacylase
MEGGALGFSTNRNERHMREDGKPIPSRLADDEEFFTLSDALGELNAGVIQSNLGQYTIKQFDTYDALVRRTGRPSVGQTVTHRTNAPERWKEQLDAVAPTFHDGYLPYLRTHTVPNFRHFTLKNAQAFDEFETWKNVMFMDEASRLQAFKDPQTRAHLRNDLADTRQTNFHRRWDIVTVEKVAKPENHKYVGKSVEAVGRMRGQDPLDAFLDLALEENLETTFVNYNSGGDSNAMAEILRSPYILVGSSDAGAHVQFAAENGYCTTFLGLWVRERGVMSLEQAIYKLTFMVASVYGLEGRGLVRPGYVADLAIFDADKVNAGEVEWLQDFPANTNRLVQRSVGMHYVVVNGRVIYQDGKLTGELPGQILRGAAYRRSEAVAA